jgi:hypothetical protein
MIWRINKQSNWLEKPTQREYELLVIFQLLSLVRPLMMPGVLTKPDMLTSGATGARQKWKEILEGGSKHGLRLGYYCVRLPDDKERTRDISRGEVDRVAHDFFNTTPPWREILAKDPQRFGIPSLVSDVSVRLTSIIEKSYVLVASTTRV